MALKPCRECGKEVSTEAKQCIHCSVKHPTANSAWVTVKGLVGSAFMLGLVWLVWTVINGSESDSNAPPPTPEVQARKDAAAAQVAIRDVKTTHDDFVGYITGYATNNGNSTLSYVMVSFNLFDARGDQVGTAMDATNNLAAGARWRFKAIVTNHSAKTFKLAQVSAF